MGVGVMHYNSKWGDFFEGEFKRKKYYPKWYILRGQRKNKIRSDFE